LAFGALNIVKKKIQNIELIGGFIKYVVCDDEIKRRELLKLL
jgi:hypothetical protein